MINTALTFGKLKNIGYKFILGRKGKEYQIQLRFPYESFFHLAGLQHLTDITYPSKSKERIYKEIIKGNLSYSAIKKSEFFEKFDIEERIKNLNKLENMLDSCELSFLINPREYTQYTRIKADYLFEKDYLNEEATKLYLFVVKELHPQIKNECKGCSFLESRKETSR